MTRAAEQAYVVVRAKMTSLCWSAHVLLGSILLAVAEFGNKRTTVTVHGLSMLMDECQVAFGEIE